MIEISHTYLTEILKYDPVSGAFTWLKPNPLARKLKVGSPAGRTIQNKYIQIGINRKYYLAHRLAVFYMTGIWPTHEVDHIDGNPSNNSWSNLRQVTSIENSRNQATRSNNSSGVVGVKWKKEISKWVATIGVDRKLIHLGCFESLEVAAEVRRAAEKVNGFHENHGKRK